MRKNWDIKSEEYKDDLTYIFSLEKIREFSDDSKLIKQARNLTFVFTGKQEVHLFNHNATKLIFNCYPNRENKPSIEGFLNDTVSLEFYIYEFNINSPNAKSNDFRNSRQIRVRFHLTNY